jgi:hypothetical protein
MTSVIWPIFMRVLTEGAAPFPNLFLAASGFGFVEIMVMTSEVPSIAESMTTGTDAPFSAIFGAVIFIRSDASASAMPKALKTASTVVA